MSFLDFPPNVRTLTYEYALVRFDCPIDLSFWQARSYQTEDERVAQARTGMHRCWRRHNSYTPSNRTCLCTRLPVALLRTCRTVHTEAASVLYGENRFVIRGRTFAGVDEDGTFTETTSSDKHTGFYRLKRLPPVEQFEPLLSGLPLYGLAQMRSLVVRLNCWPCPLGHEEADFTTRDQDNPYWELDQAADDHAIMGFCMFCNMRCDRADRSMSLTPPAEVSLEPALEKDQAMLQVWEQVCVRLSSALKEHPHKEPLLDLTFICDTSTTQAAEMVALPLLQAFLSSDTRLKSCSVRLGRYRSNTWATTIARQTAEALMSGDVSHLSRVAPLRAATDGGNDKNNTSDDTKEDSASENSSRHIFPFRRLPAELRIKILQDTGVGDARTIMFQDGRQFTDGEGIFSTACCNNCTQTRMDCCCPRFFCSVSAHCTCDIVPTELFKVDRQMYQEAALDLFYSHVTLRYESEDFEVTLQALKKLTPATLKTVRKLSLIVSSDQYRMWRMALKRSREQPVEDNGPDLRPDGELGDDDADDGARRPPFVWTYEAGRGDKHWPELVAFINDNMDVSKLSLKICVIECVWNYLMGDSTDPYREFKDAYTMYMDLVTEACKLKTLQSFTFEMAIFRNLERWLVRQVLGNNDPYRGGITEEDVESAYPPGLRNRSYRRMPQYHDVNKQLPGSNYDPQTFTDRPASRGKHGTK